MIFLAMFIGLGVCLLAAIKLVDIGYSRVHWNKDPVRSNILGLLLTGGWVTTIGLAMLILGQGFHTLSRLKSQFLYGDLADLMSALLGY